MELILYYLGESHELVGSGGRVVEHAGELLEVELVDETRGCVTGLRLRLHFSHETFDNLMISGVG